MQTREAIRTRDGKKITITVFNTAAENGKLIIIGPSAFETQEHYGQFAAFLSGNGNTVITFDYRGMGASRMEPVHKNPFSLQQWANFDLDAVLLYAKNHYPGKEIIFIGHGVSGELTGLAPASQYINRVILINTSLSCSNLWPWTGRVRLTIIKLLVPFLHLCFRYIPRVKIFTFSSLPYGVMKEWGNWCSNNNGLFDVFPDNNYRKLQTPLLAYSFTDDWRSPAKAVKSLLNHFSGCQVNWHHVKPGNFGLIRIGHSGFFDPKCRHVLWQKLLLWMDDKMEAEKNTYKSKVV